jgi:hypothetical protein
MVRGQASGPEGTAQGSEDFRPQFGVLHEIVILNQADKKCSSLRLLRDEIQRMNKRSTVYGLRYRVLVKG